MGRSALFVSKQPGGMYSVVDTSEIPGDPWYVDSGNTSRGKDASGYGKNPDSPFLTADYAVSAMTANNGDKCFLMPGHAETLTTAGAWAIDKAGLEFVGLGEGADRPTFTFSSSDNSASVLITAASTKIGNVIGICGDDGLTNPFHVQAADCELDIVWRDTTAVEAATCILTTSAADRLNINLKYEGDGATGSACVAPIILVGVDGADINVDFYGIASTSIIDMQSTACTNVVARGNFYNVGTTDLSQNMTDTATGSTWFISGYDGAAGESFSGGDGGAIASDDVSGVASQCTSIGIGTSVINSQAISVATGMISVGVGTSVINSQGISQGVAITAIFSMLTSHVA